MASLERSSVTQHEPCLALLAGATRVAHKVHQFAGGFTPECSDLFDKARPATAGPPHTLTLPYLPPQARRLARRRQALCLSGQRRCALSWARELPSGWRLEAWRSCRRSPA